MANRRNSIVSLFAAGAVLAAMAIASSRQQPPGATSDLASTGTGTPSTTASASTTSSTNPRPESRWRFVDATEPAGLAQAAASTEATGEPTMYAALALTDFNADGYTDLIASRPGQENVLLLGTGTGRFEIVADAGGLKSPAGGTGAFAIADVEGDGDDDVFTSSTSESTNRLYLNDGSGRFTDATLESGLLEETEPGGAITSLRLGATFHDWDRDGDRDLVVLHWDPYVYSKPAIERVGDGLTGRNVCEASGLIRGTGLGRDPNDPPNLSRMYRNDGGKFVDVTSSSGIDFGSIVAFTPTFADLDEDDIDDLLITGDGCTTSAYLNDGAGRFSRADEDLGLNVDENGMGSVIADLDQDGIDDWFVTAIAYHSGGSDCPGSGFFSGCRGNAAYVRDESGFFVDKARQLGLADGGWGWGVVSADLDNSGAPDLAMTNGYHSGTGPLVPGEDPETNRYYLKFESDPIRLWQATADGYEEVADVTGLLDTAVAASQGRSIAALDADGDGDLDLLVNSVDQGVDYIENQLELPNHWLEVTLDDPSSPGNRRGVGSTVSLTVGDRTVHQRIHTDGGYGTVGLPIAHFGLGQDLPPSTPLRIDVRWPDGREQAVSSPDVDQRVVVVRER